MDKNEDAIEALLDSLQLDAAAKAKAREDLVRAIAANATRRVFETLSEEHKKEYLLGMGEPKVLAAFMDKYVAASTVSTAIEDATVEVLEKFIAEIDAANDTVGG